MCILHRAKCARSRPAAPFLFLSLLALVAPPLATADDLTGLPGNDPKALLPYSATPVPAPTYSCMPEFLPMPSWARGVLMPPLPDALKPMGKPKVVAVVPPKPAPVPLQPPPDETTSAGSNTPASVSAPKPADNPAMITVSPFLQWIQSNPQAAAAEARQQAQVYRPPVPLPGANITPGPNSAAASPYWLPPLIDTPEVNSTGTSSATPTAVGGSAAIYSTPQR